MDISTEKVCSLILQARMFDVKEGETDPDEGSNAADDGFTDVLQDAPDDATESEIREMISGLNIDEQANLVALVWIGRGDYTAEEWDEALAAARDQNGISTARYLLGLPDLGDLLEEGLGALGFSCTGD